MRIDARAELGDHLAIDLDAAVENQLLALAAAGDAGGGEDFLQALGCPARAASEWTVWCGVAGADVRYRVWRRLLRGRLGHGSIIGGRRTHSQGPETIGGPPAKQVSVH